MPRTPTLRADRLRLELHCVHSRERKVQLQSARIRSAFLTSSSEPVKLNFILPARRVTRTLIVDKPLRCIRR